MQRTLITVPLVLFAGCYSTSKLTTRPVAELLRSERLLVAVVDLQNKSGEPDNDRLAKAITDTVTAELQNSGRFRMLERQRLASILKELSFGMGALVDESKAKEAGKLLGVDALLLGSLSSVKRSESKQNGVVGWTRGVTIEAAVDARLVDVQTGEIHAASEATSYVRNRRWVAFGIFKLGRDLGEDTMARTAAELACKQLAHDIAAASPAKH